MLDKMQLFGKHNDPQPQQRPGAPIARKPGEPVISPPRPEPVPAATAAKAEAKPDTLQGSRLIVGPDIKMKGVEVSDCDTLVVEGRIEATIDARVLQIAPNGVFSGTVAVDTAEIHGRLEGDLTVRKQLVIHGTGKVSGKIRYARIKVEEGAELGGEISMMERGAQGLLAKRTGT